MSEKTYFWLAELSQYGYACELCDGPHSEREGVEQALYLIRGMGLERGRKFCCVRVEQSDVEAKPHGTNQDALDDCKELIQGGSNET